MSRVQICNKTIPEDNSGVTFTFADGTTETINLADLAPEMITQLALHGIAQKGGDSYSGIKGEDIDIAKAKLHTVADNLRNGIWRAQREGSGGPVATDLARAIANVTGRDLGEVIETLSEVDSATKKKMRGLPEVAQELFRIAQEKAQKALERAQAQEGTGAGAGGSLADLFGRNAG